MPISSHKAIPTCHFRSVPAPWEPDPGHMPAVELRGLVLPSQFEELCEAQGVGYSSLRLMNYWAARGAQPIGDGTWRIWNGAIARPDSSDPNIAGAVRGLNYYYAGVGEPVIFSRDFGSMASIEVFADGVRWGPSLYFPAPPEYITFPAHWKQWEPDQYQWAMDNVLPLVAGR